MANIHNTDYDIKNNWNMKYYNYMDSMITNDARCKCEIKSRIAIAPASFNKKTALFTSQTGLKFKDRTSNLLHLEHSFVCC
jgi:hypothetical protein